MKWLLISDIHSNLEALEAVLKSAKKIGYDRTAYMGDLVGYGPDPTAVCEWAIEEQKKGTIFVKGNHDQSISDKNEYLGDYNPHARHAIEIQRNMMKPEHDEFLKSLPTSVVDGDITFVHGSPIGWTDYILEQYEANEAIRWMKSKLCFIGHTHVPVEWHYTGDGKQNHRLINVGSVGQPRDYNPKACFAIFDTDEIREEESGQVKFHRVKYDVSAVQKKMRDINMPTNLVARLWEGR